VWEAVPDEVGVPVDVRDGVMVGVPLPDALLDGLRRLARLRPRNVSRSTTAPGDSPPLAASHSSADSRTPLV
jgi:hypothetical protein